MSSRSSDESMLLRMLQPELLGCIYDAMRQTAEDELLRAVPVDDQLETETARQARARDMYMFKDDAVARVNRNWSLACKPLQDVVHSRLTRMVVRTEHGRADTLLHRFPRSATLREVHLLDRAHGADLAALLRAWTMTTADRRRLGTVETAVLTQEGSRYSVWADDHVRLTPELVDAVADAFPNLKRLSMLHPLSPWIVVRDAVMLRRLPWLQTVSLGLELSDLEAFASCVRGRVRVEELRLVVASAFAAPPSSSPAAPIAVDFLDVVFARGSNDVFADALAAGLLGRAVSARRVELRHYNIDPRAMHLPASDPNDAFGAALVDAINRDQNPLESLALRGVCISFGTASRIISAVGSRTQRGLRHMVIDVLQDDGADDESVVGSCTGRVGKLTISPANRVAFVDVWHLMSLPLWCIDRVHVTCGVTAWSDDLCLPAFERLRPKLQLKGVEVRVRQGPAASEEDVLERLDWPLAQDCKLVLSGFRPQLELIRARHRHGWARIESAREFQNRTTV